MTRTRPTVEAAGRVPASSAVPEAGRARRRAGVLCAAVGAVFASLSITALVLIDRAPGLGAPDAAYVAYYAGNGDAFVAVGLHIAPFSGIAFLWHMAAVRTLVGATGRPTPEPTRWLQLGAAVVFVGLMFAGAAAVGAPGLISTVGAGPPTAPGTARALSGVGYAMVFVYGVRAGGMYVITTTSLVRAAGLVPRWFAVAAYVLAAGLLVSTTFHPAVLVAFPVWVLALSGVLLVATRGARTENNPEDAS